MPITPKSLNTRPNGELELGGIPICELAKEYGTPLYLMDEATLRHHCHDYTDTLNRVYPNHMVVFAGKANLNLALLNLFAQEGLGVDVVSGGELYTALKSHVSREKILFHGNNKSIKELTLAIASHIRIVVDNTQELARIVTITQELNQKAKILIRIKPEIEAHTHDYIKTGHIDSKFGIDKNDLLSVIRTLVGNPLIHFAGIHSHIGSQIFDIQPFEDLAVLMAHHMNDIKDKLGITIEELNLGGGIGIQYIASDDPPSIAHYLEKMATKLKQECEKYALPLPLLIVEPGRSMVGRAGMTVYNIGTVKEIPGIKDYVFIDGGMADNPRPMMYQSQYTFTLANKATKPHTHPYSIAGKYCESGDILANGILLPHAEVGDLLTVYGTGAYNYSMASHYNRSPLPAMVLVGTHSSRLMVKRETYEELSRYDIATA